MSGEAAAVDRGCALVTGASRGIGAAIARGLAADGWAVGVHYRTRREAAEEVVEDIRSDGGGALAIGADICDPGAADELCERAEQEFGRPVLVLVNNAAKADGALAFDIADEGWDRVLDTNLSAAFRLTRRALRPMLRERFGRVVNIASAAIERPPPGQAGYVASKAGLVGFTKALAIEVARRSVTVNAIAPGLIATAAAAGVDDALLASVPAGRRGTPDEVAACARFLVSDQAGYVTGSVLTVDGGLTA